MWVWIGLAGAQVVPNYLPDQGECDFFLSVWLEGESSILKSGFPGTSTVVVPGETVRASFTMTFPRAQNAGVCEVDATIAPRGGVTLSNVDLPTVAEGVGGWGSDVRVTGRADVTVPLQVDVSDSIQPGVSVTAAASKQDGAGGTAATSRIRSWMAVPNGELSQFITSGHRKGSHFFNPVDVPFGDSIQVGNFYYGVLLPGEANFRTAYVEEAGNGSPLRTKGTDGCRQRAVRHRRHFQYYLLRGFPSWDRIYGRMRSEVGWGSTHPETNSMHNNILTEASFWGADGIIDGHTVSYSIVDAWALGAASHYASSGDPTDLTCQASFYQEMLYQQPGTQQMHKYASMPIVASIHVDPSSVQGPLRYTLQIKRGGEGDPIEVQLPHPSIITLGSP